MTKPLTSLVAPDEKDWLKITQKLRESIIYHVSERKFFAGKKGYSSSYAKAKTEGTAAPKGVPQASRSGEVDLTLTGKMLSGAKAFSSDHEGKLSWFENDAEKLEANARRGWDILKDGELIKPVRKELDKDVDELYNKRLKLVAGKTVIRI